MLDWLRKLDQHVFSDDSLSPANDDHPVLEPAVIDELWQGPARHRVTFQGALAEWTLDALGWLAALLAEASARHGVGIPLLVTASRSTSRTG